MKAVKFTRICIRVNLDNCCSWRMVRRRHIPHRMQCAEDVTRRNTRERSRVQAVNAEFERLRAILPHTRTTRRRVSKENILTYTILYIEYLVGILRDGHGNKLKTQGSDVIHPQQVLLGSQDGSSHKTSISLDEGWYSCSPTRSDWHYIQPRKRKKPSYTSEHEVVLQACIVYGPIQACIVNGPILE